MTRSTMNMFTVLGATSLMMLAVGCQRDQPAQQAQQPRPTPAFEAEVPDDQERRREQWAQPGTEPPQQQQLGTMSEVAMCASLARNSNLRVEDIEGGVAIIASPKQGVDLSTLRTDALHIAHAMSPPQGEQQQMRARPTAAAERCQLFDLGQMAERAGVIEQGNEIRILMLSRDAQEIATLRQQARTFATQWGQPGYGEQQLQQYHQHQQMQR